MTSIFLIHILCSFFLMGLIWVIQLVHYPGFMWIKPENFPTFSLFHQRRVTYIVLPLMTLELITGFYLMMANDFPQNIQVYFNLNFTGIILIWISTLFLSMPYHRRLKYQWSEENIHNLVVTNWPRTIIWSLRGLALFYLLLTRTII